MKYVQNNMRRQLWTKEDTTAKNMEMLISGQTAPQTYTQIQAGADGESRNHFLNSTRLVIPEPSQVFRC